MIPNKFKTLAVAACLSLGAGSAANALVLTVDDIGFGAGAEVVLTDAVTPGLINFSGAVGGFSVVVATGFGAPIIGGPGEAEIDFSVQAASTQAGTVQFTLEDTGLSIPTGASAFAQIVSDLGINALDDASATVETFIRIGGSVVFEALSSLSSMSGNVDLVEELGRAIGAGETFDLMSVITMSHVGDQSFSSADANIKVSAVPLPAALPLLLGSFLGLGYIGRRGRKTV